MTKNQPITVLILFTNIHEPEANNYFSIITQVIIEIPKQRNDRKVYLENYIFLVTTTRTDHMVIHHMVKTAIVFHTF